MEFINNYLGEIISIGTALFWTITVISFEYAGKKVGSLSVNFIRLILAFIFISTTVYMLTGNFIPVGESAHVWNYLLISGVIGLVIGDFFLFQAFVDIGGRISLLIMSSVPIISSIFGFFLYKEILAPLQMIGMIIIISSIVIVILSKREKGNIHPHVVRGITFAFIGAAAQAIGLILSKEGMFDITAVNEIEKAFLATEIRIISAIGGFIILITIRKEWTNVFKAFKHTKAILFILVGSLFGPFLGVTSQLLAIRYTTLGIHTTISQLNVIMIIPFSIFMFKDKVSVKEIIGSITACIGVLLLFL
jgi:drug/metabolite transporter (DMT)-like permease